MPETNNTHPSRKFNKTQARILPPATLLVNTLTNRFTESNIGIGSMGLLASSIGLVRNGIFFARGDRSLHTTLGMTYNAALFILSLGIIIDEAIKITVDPASDSKGKKILALIADILTIVIPTLQAMAEGFYEINKTDSKSRSEATPLLRTV